ncbi:MAG: hypothetical protein QGG64_18840, partial [Candidatus Latescibacteria bacterium]|nr:hypothetical protein [Candidatus Latescibacterota bacterium]
DEKTIASADDGEWLKNETLRQLEGCRVESDSGIWLHTPDGIGHYKALWTRDFYYHVKYAGDLMDRDEVKLSIAYLIEGQRDDGCVPDRVKADGMPIYSPGGEHKPMADHALDNGAFLALLACEYVNRFGDIEFFRKIESKLKKGLDHTRRAENGLVYNSPEHPECLYGFTDIITKTGHHLFTSLLYYQACTEMALVGADSDETEEYNKRAQLIREHIGILSDEKTGMFFAADHDCKQIDIWGSAFASYVGLVSDERTKRIAQYFIEHWDSVVQRGQVRHLTGEETWERLFHDCKPGEYQNGAYWSTPLPWFAPVVATVDPARAQQMLVDVIEEFKANGVAECMNGNYRKVPDFVVGITNLYGVYDHVCPIPSETSHPPHG